MSRVVQSRRNRQTGTTILLVDRGVELTDLPTGESIPEDRWETICQEHGGVCSHETRKVAESFAAAPLDWCETCQEEDEFGSSWMIDHERRET